MKVIKPIYLLIIISGCILISCNNKEQKTTESEESPVVEENKEPEQGTENQGEHPGVAVFTQNCSVCHQADGSGVPGLYPPLQNTDWINDDATRLISLVLNGLSGPIEVNGENYNNAMPQFSYLSDQEIADVLTYLRGNFGNDAGAISPEMVAEVRASGTE